MFSPKVFSAAFFALAGALLSAAEIADLSAEARDGQVFLQWQEKELPQDARLTVWSSAAPITSLKASGVRCEADLLNPGSARDWWQDINSFYSKEAQNRKSKKGGKAKKFLKEEDIFAGNVATENTAQKEIPGFIIKEDGKPLDPKSGLHVHTPAEAGSRYFAVSWKKGLDGEVQQFITVKSPVKFQQGKVTPFACAGKPLRKGCATGKPLILSVHGRGGGAGVDGKGNPVGNYLMFMNKDQAWREGIPMKFTVNNRSSHVELSLNDRIWIGRILPKEERTDSRDNVYAIATFWMAYNTNIARHVGAPDLKADNYTERWVIYLVRWAQEYLGTDPDRTYVVGGSMGGTAAIQFATHYPEVFAAVHAMVPVYAFSWKCTPGDQDTAHRLFCSCGKFTQNDPVRMPDGQDVTEYGDGSKNINRPAVDMPMIFACNGRTDKSIPWVNNPDFYRAANEARQGFCVYWNNGDHKMSNKRPKDMIPELKELFRYRKHAPYVVFSNCSTNRNYGNGDPKDGDQEGWINRGMKWDNVKESANSIEFTVSADYPGISYPVTADVTLRGRQQFRPAPGTSLTACINGQKSPVTVDANGLLTIPGVSFADGEAVKVVVKK